MSSRLHTTLGDELYAAWHARAPVAPLSSRPRRLSLDDAYRIQQRFIERRIEHGEAVVGKKIGVTSQAVQDMLNVRQPDFGILLSGMHYAAGEAIAADTLIAPRAEGEIAFILARDLRGPGIDRTDVIAATAAVAPCFEIVDSRIRDWAIRIEDTVADNASCGVYVLGDARVDPRTLDLAACEMTIDKNGEQVAQGRGDAALGHPPTRSRGSRTRSPRTTCRCSPARSCCRLAKLIPVTAGDALSMHISGIGSCDVRFI